MTVYDHNLHRIRPHTIAYYVVYDYRNARHGLTYTVHAKKKHLIASVPDSLKEMNA
jgi:hypothetical protein